MSDDSATPPTPSPDEEPQESLRQKMRHVFFGAARDPSDTTALHKLTLVAFLAWVGLGADGLSSSSYGPEEAFRALGTQTYLALALAIATAVTVFIISASYSSIIQQFPTGGGGYLVASSLLGPKVGVVSGSALIVDYMLTISVSIVSGGNAVFSFLPRSLWHWRVIVEIAAIILLIILNLRGVKESVKILMPVFIIFLITHALLILWSIFARIHEVPVVTHQVTSGFSSGLTTLGIGGMLLLFFRAYSMGGGTYTGIEAVSNGLQIMREPRVETGRRTMIYMSISLALTAGGILIGYLLHHTAPVDGRTMNAVLAHDVFGSWQIDGLHVGRWLVLVTLLSEGLLLFVAAQAGFIDGPRVMSNMAVDSYFPHRFAALSERLTMQNGVLLMGGAALALVFYTEGNIHVLVVMYSINVFLTFTLSQLGMTRFWIARRKQATAGRHLSIHIVALVLCSGILVITTLEKFAQGGWVTVVITGIFILICYGIRAHYDFVKSKLRQLDEVLGSIPTIGEPNSKPLDPKSQTAVLLVSSFNGFGVHTMLSILRFFPGLYKQFVFVSIAVVDSGHFKGKEEIDSLIDETESAVAQYVDLARRLGFPAEAVTDVGVEVVEQAAEVCREVARHYPKSTIFTGKLVFKKDHWLQKFLHNETAMLIQRRLQWMGVPMVTIPIRAEV